MDEKISFGQTVRFCLCRDLPVRGKFISHRGLEFAFPVSYLWEEFYSRRPLTNGISRGL
jgi:hypothetical protein